MIKKSKYYLEKDYKKERNEFYKTIRPKSLKTEKVEKLIRDTINDWEDIKYILCGRGHNFDPPTYLKEKNIPNEVVDYFTKRNYGFECPPPYFRGYDEDTKSLRFLEPNEYVDGITMWMFHSQVCKSLGLETSNKMGRGSSSHDNCNSIRKYLGLQSIEELWKKEREEKEDVEVQ